MSKRTTSEWRAHCALDPSPPRPKPRPRKRKATETPEKEASDDEASVEQPEKKKAKTQLASKPAGQDASAADAASTSARGGQTSGERHVLRSIRSCFDAYLAEVSPGRKRVVIPEVVIQSSPPVSRSKVPRQEEDLAASLGKSLKESHLSLI